MGEFFPEHADITRRFHEVWYSTGRYSVIEWLGIQLHKNPFDLWIYQEILYRVQPRVVIETGTFQGGSALYLATVLDAIADSGGDHGEVISIDIASGDYAPLPNHPRIAWERGSSTDPEMVAKVTAWTEDRVGVDDHVLVILDADHTDPHVEAEMDAYGPLVTVGSYLIVEDTNIGGNPALPGWEGGPGPRAAVERWMPRNPGFSADRQCERLLLTMNPGGFLHRDW